MWVEGRQLIHGDVEEALDLAGVQVHGEDAVGAGGLDQVGEQARRNRHARLVLLVAASVGVVRDDGRDAAGRGAAEGVDHDQQLHDAGVHRRAERLDQEDVAAADVLLDADEDVLVAELEDIAGAQGHFEMGADTRGQRDMSTPAEHRKVIEVGRGHLVSPFCARDGLILTLECPQALPTRDQ